MATTTIFVDATCKARLAELARQTGQKVDEFVGGLSRRVADADVRFDPACPFPSPTGRTDAHRHRRRPFGDASDA